MQIYLHPQIVACTGEWVNLCCKQPLKRVFAGKCGFA